MSKQVCSTTNGDVVDSRFCESTTDRLKGCGWEVLQSRVRVAWAGKGSRDECPNDPLMKSRRETAIGEEKKAAIILTAHFSHFPLPSCFRF